jgi:LemA protein
MRGQAKTILVVLVAGVVLLGVYAATTYNALVKLREQIPGACAQVENVLQRRNDLIPNLVNTVKGYAKHEQQILNEVSKALQSFNRATTVNEKIAADNTITGLLSRIMAISLQYPNLKADQQFIRLQDELAGTENRIAVERMRFNQMVQEYNTKVKTFPPSPQTWSRAWAVSAPLRTTLKQPRRPKRFPASSSRDISTPIADTV